MATFGKSIRQFLVDGTPNGRCICELSNWTGVAYKIPRTMVKDSSDRKELSAPGVYFLFGSDEESGKQAVYIGEAEDILVRLGQHLVAKEFWNEVIVLISSSSGLNKAHIKYLENRFYTIALDAKRYHLENASVPTQSSISEADKAELEEFIYNARMLVAVLGHKVFEPVGDKAIAAVGSSKQETGDTLVCSRKNFNGSEAYGMRTSEGFVLLKGSYVHNELNPNKKWVARLRETYGNVVGKDRLTTEDILFASPSAASCFVIGNGSSGLVEWKDKNGKTLKEIEGA